VLPAALVGAAGAVALIEMAYRRSTQPESGTRMELFGIAMETAAPWPWLAAGAAATAGWWLLRRALPGARAAWAQALAQAGTGAVRERQ
jgi:hypothetical protein